MIKEVKLHGFILKAQTTYYVYLNKDEAEKDNYLMCTNDQVKAKKFIHRMRDKQLLKQLES
jgi:hypothetical protein